jgi:hypothetical protein
MAMYYRTPGSPTGGPVCPFRFGEPDQICTIAGDTRIPGKVERTNE